MKVLVVGGGGREHALCWKINQSAIVDEVYCAPGNAGIQKVANCVDIQVNDFDSLISFAKDNNIELTVVGPELPLCMGIVNEFEKEGLKIFGPTKAAARIEGSKLFSKDIMKKYGVPTANYDSFTDREAAKEFLKTIDSPFVIKADGLAAGKGVVICNSVSEGEDTLNSIMGDKIFGDAGDMVVIEEFLEGEEASFFAFTDGKNILPLKSSQDHKAIFDGDRGPNTGGMGAYTPAPIINGLENRIINEVIKPVIVGLNIEGCEYRGILYAGLMIKDDQIKVLEFNCRFGDPEAQPLLIRMESDIVPILMEIADGNLNRNRIDWKEGAAVCVVMASKGYPGNYQKGIELNSLDKIEESDELIVFHAGTKAINSKVVTNGGRVLGVTALGRNIGDAINKAYSAVNIIDDSSLYYRKDIGNKALN